MTTENMSAREALDEVARRREQTVAAGNTDWTWSGTAITCTGLLVMGVGYDLDQLWLVVVALAGLIAAGASTVRLRRDLRGPGTGFIVWLFATMLVALIVAGSAWRLMELPFENTAGMVGACLVLVAATPFASRRAVRRGAERTGRP